MRIKYKAIQKLHEALPQRVQNFNDQIHQD